MIPDAIDLRRATVSVTETCKDVNLMPLAVQSRRQVRHMRRYSTDRYRVERFPGERGNSHTADCNLQLASANSDDVTLYRLHPASRMTSPRVSSPTLASPVMKATVSGFVPDISLPQLWFCGFTPSYPHRPQ